MAELQKVTEWVREELKNNMDEEYKEFHKSLVPGLESMMGIRIPKMREIAKKAAKEDYEDFAEHADLSVYEELMIRGMIIGYGKLTDEERKAELKKFVPFINNWAICDSCCTTYKFMKKIRKNGFLLSKNFFTAAGNLKSDFQWSVCWISL